MPTDTRPVAAYLRLSMAKEDSSSIPAQRRLAHEEAVKHGWPEPVVFMDEGISGSKTVRRPGRDDLERRIAAGEFRALIVKSVDRLARSVVDFHRIAASCRASGCALVITDMGLDSSEPVGEMVLGILAQIAQFEVRLTSARVKVTNEEKTRAGRVIGGPVPFGFRNARHADKPGTYRVVDDAQAEVVRGMVADVLGGRSLHSIADRLHREGVPMSRADNAARRGTTPPVATSWTAMAVRRILRNPALAGMQRRQGDLVRDDSGLPRVLDAAILTPSEWRRLQTALDQRAGAGRRTRLPFEERLLLDPLAVCGGCGARMTRNSTKTKAGRRVHCYSCSKGRPGCPAPGTMTSALLDAYVESAFLQRVGHLPVFEAVEGEDTEVAAQLMDVIAERERLTSALLRATADEQPRLFDLIATLTRSEEALRLRAAERAPVRYVRTGATRASAYASAPSASAKRELLASAVVEIEVDGGRRPIEDRVRIVWAEVDSHNLDGETSDASKAMLARHYPEAFTTA